MNKVLSLYVISIMQIEFYKYQGTGNDFIVVDNRRDIFPKKNTKIRAQLCDRRFGIGGDGLILLENDRLADFKMDYYNSDGRPGSMCGNGGRCVSAFAKFLGIIADRATFNAADGLHEVSIHAGDVSLKMKDVAGIKEKPHYLYIDTGSPHHVQMVKNLEKFDVRSEGERLRYGLYGKKGSNINFVEALSGDVFAVRTYERGVEDETLSCGTGVTAVALGMYHLGKTRATKVAIQTRGGRLEVSFEPAGNGFKNIYLNGPAEQVFKGIWDVKA